MNRLTTILIALAVIESLATTLARADELQSAPATPLANGTMAVYWKHPAKTDAPRRVLIHFHGAPETVCSAFVRSELEGVLVVVNFPGLSSAYSKPFAANESLFSELLRRARVAVSQRDGEQQEKDWSRVSVSSFSAGYGAVREILKKPGCFDRIDDIVAADSIYAGLQSDTSERLVNEQQMSDFLRFAALAAEGKKTFVISHSAQNTPYASTTETADYLLHRLMIDRRPDATMAAPKLQQTTAAGRRGFVVCGFAGEAGADHMQHLYNIDLLWKRIAQLDEMD